MDCADRNISATEEIQLDSIPLQWGIFSNWPDDKYFRLFRPCGLRCSHSSTPLAQADKPSSGLTLTLNLRAVRSHCAQDRCHWQSCQVCSVEPVAPLRAFSSGFKPLEIYRMETAGLRTSGGARHPNQTLTPAPAAVFEPLGKSLEVNIELCAPLPPPNPNHQGTQTKT